MNNVDKQYLEMLQYVLDNGDEKADRTGVGTKSIFGYQTRYNLSKGFPMLTTKKVFWKGVVEELLWFLRGETNIKSLVDKGVHIWDAWADKDGELGPVYGFNWRKWGAKPDKIPQKTPKLRTGLNATYLGVANGAGKEKHILAKTWEGMISRCYNKNDIGYDLYGGRGVSVDDCWLEFNYFAQDAEKLLNWENKKKNPRKYVLDKDGIGDGFLYSVKTCQWITPKENELLKNTKNITVKEIATGKNFTFNNASEFCKNNNFSDKNFSDLWTGTKNAKIRNGFELVSVEDTNKGIDQIANVIEQIKTNPNSRRLIVNAWNVGEIDKMALPPCHMSFQFYVSNNKLSCQLYQRSGDIFLGIPFNIASYSLLTHMIAQVCDLEVGSFVHTIGDAHIYLNHLDQVREQLSRTSFDLPTLELDKTIKNIDDFKSEHIKLVNYNSHPAIKAPIAV